MDKQIEAAPPPAPRTALEQSFNDICGTAGLSSLGVYHYPRHLRPFAVHAHCDSLSGVSFGDTLSEALGGAIADLQVKRAAAASVELADEAMVPA